MTQQIMFPKFDFIAVELEGFDYTRDNTAGVHFQVV